MKTLYILTVLVALVSVVSSVLIKKERCQFAKFPKYYTSCKNDATICSDSGGEFNPCEGDTPDPENMYFCTAEISDIPELKRPWVKCSDDCFDANSDPKEYDDTTSCSAVATTCKFPFKWNEKTYTSCTDDIVVDDDDVKIIDEDGTIKQTFQWCATSVNENQFMKNDKWGICDLKPKDEPKPSKMRCNVKSQRCNAGCQQQDEDSKYFCQTDDVSGKPTGECDENCFENDEPKKFQGIEATISGCKTRPSECQFPFEYRGKTYHHCTDTLIDDGSETTRESFRWCATQTDTNGRMVEGKWGVCDLETCRLEDESSPTISAVANIFPEKEGGIKATIDFKQQKGGILKITGTVSGLTQGSHGFHVHEIPDTSDQCRAAGGHFNPSDSTHGKICAEESHAGDLGNIQANDDGEANIEIYILPGCQTTLFGDNTIIGHTLVIHDGADDLGQGNSTASLTTGDAGSRLACAIIEESSEGKALQWYIYLLIALAILFLIIIAYLLFQYFKNKRGDYVPTKDPTKQKTNGVIAKDGPLFDELSIPFIDASPTNTPRLGRSVERLGSFFKGSIGRSRGSLSNDEATA